MFKNLSKVLILTLVFNLTIFLPLHTIFSVKKPKAQISTQPVTPTEPFVTFRTSSSDYKDLIVAFAKDKQNQLKITDEYSFDFVKKIEKETLFSHRTDPLKTLLSGDFVSINLYKIKSPMIVCSSNEYGQNHFYAASIEKTQGKFIFAGIFINGRLNSDPENNDFRLIDFSIGHTVSGAGCADAYRTEKTKIDDLLFLRNKLGQNIAFSIRPEDKNRLCATIASSWDQMKADIRKLFSPIPATENNKNEYWMVKSEKKQDELGPGYQKILLKIMDAINNNVFETKPTNFDQTREAVNGKLIYPNSAGLRILEQIIENGKVINEYADQILASENPKCENIILRKFKWDENLENDNNSYDNLSDFIKSISGITQTAEEVQKEIQEARNPEDDGDNNCGKLNFMKISFADFWNYSGCQIAFWIHSMMKGIFKKAFKYLNASLGT